MLFLSLGVHVSFDHVDLEGLVFLGGVGQFIALDLILRGMRASQHTLLPGPALPCLAGKVQGLLSQGL